MTNKAIVTQINYAGISFDGLMLPDGSYRIGASQLEPLVSVRPNQATRTVKRLCGKDFQFDRVASELNPKKVNTITLDQFGLIVKKLARQGNDQAWSILDACLLEKLERIFDDAFGVVVEEREREQRFAARLMTKATFRPLTDELQKQGFKHGWEYGKYIRAFQDALGFDCGTRDDLDLSTLLRLGNCQSELKCLMKAGYKPWDALELWIDQNW